jgi:hypothetical protein
MEHTNEIFDLQGDVLRDNSMVSKILREYRSDATPSDNELNIVINVRDTSEWIDLSSAYIECGASSYGAGGGGVGTNAAASNSGLECGATSMFSSSRLRISNTLVESNDVLSHYNSFTKQIMSFCDDYSRSIAISAGFVLDTGTAANDTAYTTVLYQGLNGTGDAADLANKAVSGITTNNAA